MRGIWKGIWKGNDRDKGGYERRIREIGGKMNSFLLVRNKKYKLHSLAWGQYSRPIMGRKRYFPDHFVRFVGDWTRTSYRYYGVVFGETGPI